MSRYFAIIVLFRVPCTVTGYPAGMLLDDATKGSYSHQIALALFGNNIPSLSIAPNQYQGSHRICSVLGTEEYFVSAVIDHLPLLTAIVTAKNFIATRNGSVEVFGPRALGFYSPRQKKH